MLMHQDRELTEPLITPENQAFFNATAQGSLLLRHCQSCGQSHYYPRNLCPLCGSDQTDWLKASSVGEIYSFSVLRKGVDIPYCIAYVSLPGGVSILSNIVDCDLDSVRIGQSVKLCFKSTPKGTRVPMFTLA
jgi:uncharacterized protein